METMRISQSAERSGVAASTLRYYEERGLLPDRPGRCDPECDLPDLAHDRPRITTLPVLPSAAHQAPAVACSLDAPGIAERIGQWQRLLRGARREEFPGGLRLSLPAERAADVAGLAAAEQECCAFFAFTLHLNDGRVHVEVRAPAQARDLLTEVFGPGEPRRAPEGSPVC